MESRKPAYIYKKRRTLSLLSLFHPRPRAPARTRVRVCLGVNHGKQAREAMPSCGERSPTLVRVGLAVVGWPVVADPARSPHVAKRWPTARGANLAGIWGDQPAIGRYFQNVDRRPTPAGTGPKWSRVCFAGWNSQETCILSRQEITAAVVEEAERLLTEGLDHSAIRARIGVTQYVLGILARRRGRSGQVPARRRSNGQVLNSQRGIDATTIRSIQRMLATGILSHVEIGREAGVSPNTVSDVASGKRRAITLTPPILGDGERFLPEPIRCSVCRATISVIPCRACAATRERELV